jgi:hypothetical protein
MIPKDFLTGARLATNFNPYSNPYASGKMIHGKMRYGGTARSAGGYGAARRCLPGLEEEERLKLTEQFAMLRRAMERKW